MEQETKSSKLTMSEVQGEKDSKKYDLKSLNLLANQLFSNLKVSEAIEIRSLGRKGIKHGLFRSREAFIRVAKDISGIDPLYFSLNPRRISALKKDEEVDQLYPGTSYGNGDVENLRHIIFDFDRAVKKKPATDEELSDCLKVAEQVSEMLRERNVVHWLIMSGNGYHIFIQIKETAAEVGSKQLRQLLEGLNAAYSNGVVQIDTGVCDAARICKLYGTQSIKDGADLLHPNRISKIIKFEQLREEPLFEKLSDFVQLKEVIVSSVMPKTNLVEIFKKHNLYIRPLAHGKHIVNCPNRSAHGQNSDGSSTTAIFDGTNEHFGFKCFHTSCNSLHLKEALLLLDENVVEQNSVVRGRPEKFDLMSLKDLLDKPAPTHQWLVKDLLTVGGTSIFVSRPKSGKATLLRDLACCVAGNEPWLGFPTQSGPVIYLAFEEKLEMLQIFFKERAISESSQLFLHAGIAPRKSIDMLEDLIKKYKAKLLIVDTMLRLETLKEPNDYSETNERMERINHIARQTGCHIALVHHQGKGADENSGEESVLGSTAISGGVDSIFSLRRDRGGLRFLTSTQRYGKDLVRMGLILNKNTQKFELKDAKEHRQESLSERIVNCLEASNPQTAASLVENLKSRKKYVMDTLDILIADGTVIKSGLGVRNNSFQYSVPKNDSPVDIFS